MTTDQHIDSIDERLGDGSDGPSDADVAFLIIELRRAREVFHDLLTSNALNDVRWVSGRLRFGLGDP